MVFWLSILSLINWCVFYPKCKKKIKYLEHEQDSELNLVEVPDPDPEPDPKPEQDLEAEWRAESIRFGTSSYSHSESSS